MKTKNERTVCVFASTPCNQPPSQRVRGGVLAVASVPHLATKECDRKKNEKKKYFEKCTALACFRTPLLLHAQGGVLAAYQCPSASH